MVIVIVDFKPMIAAHAIERTTHRQLVSRFGCFRPEWVFGHPIYTV
jgi:hypothetical protein